MSGWTNDDTFETFFHYYGSKWRAVPRYAPPIEDLIIEPFAGSAAYALCYPRKKVWLNDLDPKIAALWEYLIAADKEEILSIPLVKDEIGLRRLPPEQRILIGFWWGKALVQPATKPTGWLTEGKPLYEVQYWGAARRQRIAEQVGQIKHWKITQMHYEDLPNERATWFIDPPYDNTPGEAYVHGRSGLDYTALGRWCKARAGQSIVCENAGADWLPFEVLGEFKTARKRKSIEVVWNG